MRESIHVLSIPSHVGKYEWRVPERRPPASHEMQSDKMPSGEIVSAKRPTRPQRTAPLDGGGGRAVASDPIRSMETFEIIELPEAAEAEAAGGDPDVEAPPLP